MVPDQKYERPANIIDLAARLADFGYYPVPIPAGCKGPVIAGWDKLRLTAEKIPAYFSESNMLVGCLHANLACFDIDVTDPALAEEIVTEGFRRFPGALERIGRAPKSAIVLRLPEPGFTVRNTEKHSRVSDDGEVFEAQVEVRTATRQMVVYGLHPDTGKPYTWPRGQLWETPLEALPPITQEAAQSFRDWCNDRIRAWSGAEAQTAKIIDLGTYQPGTFQSLKDDMPGEAEFLEALSYVPASLGHESGWRESLMAIHDFFGGSMRGLEIAKQWSSADPRYNPREVETKWASFEVGKGVGHKSVFHLAKLNGCDLPALAKKHRPKAAAVALSDPRQYGDAEEQPQPDAPKSRLEWFDDIVASLSDAYLIKGVLSQGSMSVIYGPSNSGKTFFALDLAYHVAIGADWRGRRVKQAPVLYLAAEGGRGIANRIAALKATHGVCDVPLALRRAGLDLLHSEPNLQELVELAFEAQERMPDAPLLIVVDTLSRVIAGGDENSAADMTAFIRNIDAVREMTRAHVMIVHHTGKDTARGARGHSSLRAATDTEIEVGNDNGARAALVTKQRDYQGGETFAFALDGVLLGYDDEGEEVKSCVLQTVDDEEHKAATARTKGLGGVQKIIADTFDQMVGEGLGRPNPGGVGMPESGQFWAVERAELRRLCLGKIEANDARSSFNKAFNALTADRGLFCTGENLVWRIDRRITK